MRTHSLQRAQTGFTADAGILTLLSLSLLLHLSPTPRFSLTSSKSSLLLFAGIISLSPVVAEILRAPYNHPLARVDMQTRIIQNSLCCLLSKFLKKQHFFNILTFFLNFKTSLGRMSDSIMSSYMVLQM